MPVAGWPLSRIRRDGFASPLRWLAAAMLFLAIAALLAVPARAQSFPAFTGFVVDAANVLPPEQEAALTKRLDDLQRATGTQLIVATIPSLEDRPIDDYGYRLLRAWGVGLKDVNNGAILIVAPNDRQVRIEVGYGLEPTLTDAVSSIIINQQILPKFREGDVPGGIVAGAGALVDLLATPDAERAAKVAAATAEYDRTHKRAGDVGGSGFTFAIWGIVALFVLLTMLRGRGGGGGGRRARSFGGSNWPIILWTVADAIGHAARGGDDDDHGGFGGFGGGGGGWGGGGFGGGGGGSGGGGGASGSW